jgi:hypothetical protein
LHRWSQGRILFDTRKPRKPVDLKRDVREGRREEYKKTERYTKKTQNYININNLK